MSNVLAALVPAIGWALLHFIWQGLLIGWGTKLALDLLRGARAQTRYALACAALLLCAALPLAGIAWRLHGAADSATVDADVLLPALHLAAAGAARHGVAAIAPNADWSATWRVLLGHQLSWIVALWLCGAGVMTLRLAIGLQWVVQRTRPGQYKIDHHWQMRLAQLARRFGISQHVRLGVAQLLDSPITAGCWRPIVLVPAALIGGMPPDLLEALLAHELAHIKRNDYLVNLLQSAIEILLFYHPSVWMLSQRIRIEREQVADDLAASVLGQPHRLAQALSELDRFQFTSTQLAHAAHGGDLMSRIKRLLRPEVEPLSWKMVLPLLGLCAASAVLYAQAAPQPAASAAVSVSAIAAEQAPTASVPPAPTAPAAPAALAAAPALAAPPAPPAPSAPSAPPAPAAEAALPAPALPALPPAPALPAIPAAPATPALPALPAIPPAAAISAPPAAPVLTEHSHSIHYNGTYTEPASGEHLAHPYALVHAGQQGITVSASAADMKEVAQLREHVKGDFLWFRDGGKSYLVQDPAIIAQADASWASSRQLGKQMDEQSAKMDAQGKVLDAMGERMNAVEKTPASREAERNIEQLSHQIEALASQQAQLGQELGRLAAGMADQSAEQRSATRQAMAQVRAQMEPLREQMRQLGSQMAQQGQRMSAEHAPMRDIGKQMHEASLPLQELGRTMAQLGREQARVSREADRSTRELAQKALKAGKAVPAPVASSAQDS